MANTTLHAAVGMGIVSIVPNPFVCLPLCFISHYLLDYFPEHIGFPTKWMMFIEAILGICIVTTLVMIGSWLMFWGAIISNLPDVFEGIYCLLKKKWFEYPKWVPSQTCSMKPIPNAVIDLIIVLTILGLLI